MSHMPQPLKKWDVPIQAEEAPNVFKNLCSTTQIMIWTQTQGDLECKLKLNSGNYNSKCMKIWY